MLLRLIEDGKPEIFQQQIYDLPVIIARMDLSQSVSFSWLQERSYNGRILREAPLFLQSVDSGIEMNTQHMEKGHCRFGTPFFRFRFR